MFYVTLVVNTMLENLKSFKHKVKQDTDLEIYILFWCVAEIMANGELQRSRRFGGF